MPSTNNNLSQILKVVGKLKRILDGLSPYVKQKEKEKISMIDQALYCAIKIQKLANKQISKQNQLKADEGFQRYQQNKDKIILTEDTNFNQAMQIITKFKSTTNKLQRKIGVLLNQTKYPSSSGFGVGPGLFQAIKNQSTNKKSKSKSKRQSKWKQYTPQNDLRQIDQSQNQQYFEDPSIIRIDNQIKMLSNKLLEEMKNDTEQDERIAIVEKRLRKI